MMRAVTFAFALACAIFMSPEISAAEEGITVDGVNYSCANGDGVTMKGGFGLANCSCPDGSECVTTKVGDAEMDPVTTGEMDPVMTAADDIKEAADPVTTAADDIKETVAPVAPMASSGYAASSAFLGAALVLMA